MGAVLLETTDRRESRAGRGFFGAERPRTRADDADTVPGGPAYTTPRRAAAAMSSEYFDSIWEQVHEHHLHGGGDRFAALAAEFAGAAGAVLDAGCGDGARFAALASGGARLYAADRSALALERAARRVEHDGLGEVELRLVGDDERIPYDDNLVERAWCCGVLEHVVDTQTFLSELRRVLKPGGELLVVTPGHSLAMRLRLALRGWGHHFDPFSSRLRFYTARSLADALTDCGFEPPKVSRDGDLLMARARRL